MMNTPTSGMWWDVSDAPSRPCWTSPSTTSTPATTASSSATETPCPGLPGGRNATSAGTSRSRAVCQEWPRVKAATQAAPRVGSDGGSGDERARAPDHWS
jgi:hypothetical protein